MLIVDYWVNHQTEHDIYLQTLHCYRVLIVMSLQGSTLLWVRSRDRAQQCLAFRTCSGRKQKEANQHRQQSNKHKKEKNIKNTQQTGAQSEPQLVARSLVSSCRRACIELLVASNIKGSLSYWLADRQSAVKRHINQDPPSCHIRGH